DEAEAVDADLVVMGAHRRHLLGEVFTGTTVERVMRVGGRPVLMANRDDDAAYRTVLAAVDRSPLSAHALRTAVALRLLDPARAAIVHGLVPLAEGAMAIAGVGCDEIENYVAANLSEARAALERFLRAADPAFATATILVEEAGPFEAITAAVG